MPQQQQPQNDTGYDILYLIVFVFAVLYAVWYFFNVEISVFIFQLKLYQAKFIDLFFDDLDFDIVMLTTVDPGAVSLEEIYEIATDVGKFFRYPIIFLLGIMAYYLYSHSIVNNFRQTYSMHTLANLEKVNWPQITPALQQDLVSQDLMVGPWSMSLSPMDFAKKHKIISVVKSTGRGRRKKPDKVSLLGPEARQVFINQLGPQWTSVDDIPIYAQALFAIFAARINRNSAEADKMIKQLSRSAGAKTMNYSGVKELLNKYLNTKIVQQVIENHAYYLTVMSSMLLRARDDGVVASCDFLWLKPIDRVLWYTINTIGRQTPFAEVGGVYAHWVAELTYGKAILTPMVDTAVHALDFALSEIIYTEDTEE